MVALAAIARPLTPAQRAWLRALDRAKSVATRKPIFTPSVGTYRVFSPRAQGEYTITPSVQGRRVEYACTCTAHARGLICWHKALCAACPIEVARRNRAKAAPQCGACAGSQVAKEGDICNGCTMAAIGAHLAPPIAAEIAESEAIKLAVTRDLVAFDATYALPASLVAARSGLR